MANELTFKTGIKTYDIKDEDGNPVCSIKVNTTDINILTNILNLNEKIKEIAREIPDSKDDESAIEFLKSPILKEIDVKIRKCIDEAFNSEITDKLFGNTNCLSPNSDGDTLVERFVNMIAPVIGKEYEKALKASNRKISKYTSQATRVR